jgi:hypothetical protein
VISLLLLTLSVSSCDVLVSTKATEDRVINVL